MRSEYVSGEDSEPNPGRFATTLGLGGDNRFDVSILLESLLGGNKRSLLQHKHQQALDTDALGDNILFAEFLFGEFSGARKEHTPGIGPLLFALVGGSCICGMVCLCLSLDAVATPTGGSSSDGVLVHGFGICIHGVVSSHQHGGIQGRIQYLFGSQKVHPDFLFCG